MNSLFSWISAVTLNCSSWSRDSWSASNSTVAVLNGTMLGGPAIRMRSISASLSCSKRSKQNKKTLKVVRLHNRLNKNQLFRFPMDNSVSIIGMAELLYKIWASQFNCGFTFLFILINTVQKLNVNQPLSDSISIRIIQIIRFTRI